MTEEGLRVLNLEFDSWNVNLILEFLKAGFDFESNYKPTNYIFINYAHAPIDTLPIYIRKKRKNLVA